MTELSFAKAFLTTLDSRPVKVQSDYAADLRTLQLTVPYTLPRMPKAMQKPASESSDAASSTDPSSDPTSSSSSSLTVLLKSMRNPRLELTVEDNPAATTTVLDLKRKVAAAVGLADTDKVRLLYRKKPCSDMKTLREVLGANEGGEAAAAAAAAPVEFGVMVIGGVPEQVETTTTTTTTTSTATAVEPPVAALGKNGEEVLATQDFWTDLEGFLQQRVKNSEVASEATKVFRTAWQSR